MKRNIRRTYISLALIGAIVVGAFLFPLAAAGLTVPALGVGALNYKLGATVVLNGSIVFTANEQKTISSVALQMPTGPQPCNATLPVATGNNQSVNCALSGSGALSVDVSYSGVTRNGSVFTAGPSGGSILYTIRWRSPVLLAPPPSFTLLPQTSHLFDIPPIPTPVAQGGVTVAALPTLTEKFAIPDLVALGLIPTPEAGLPAPLPQLTDAFAVPLIPQPSAAGGLLDLPDVEEAFDVPVIPLPTPESGAPDDLPEVTQAWNIPALPTPTPVSGLTDFVLPLHTSAFTIPTVTGGTQSAKGIATDGTSFYLIVDDDGSGTTPKDKIIKVTSAGALVTAFDDDGIVDGDSNDLAGIAYAVVSNVPTLFVWNNNSEDTIAVRKYNPTTGASTGSIARATINATSPGARRMADIAPDGSRFWALAEDGCALTQFSASGSEQQHMWINCSNARGLAVKGTGDDIQFFFGAGTDVRQFGRSGNNLTTGETYTLEGLDDIQGLLQSGGVLYVVDGSSVTARKSALPHGVVIEGTPKGMATDPDGIHVWMLVDATPKDVIAKVLAAASATQSAGALIASFDAPTANTTAITYMSNFLWVAEKASNQNPTIRKINPTSGVQSASITPVNFGSEIGGMTNNGSNLFVTANDQWDQCTYEVNEVNGNIVNTFCAQRSFNGGTGLARKSDGTYFVAKSDQINRLDTDLVSRIGTWTTEPSLDIQGMTFVGNTLFMADATEDSGVYRVYKASIPHGIEITTDPLGMTYDGTSLWILIDATPLDKIAKVNPANGDLLDYLQAASADSTAITYLDNHLWVAQTRQFQNTTIAKIDPVTHTVKATVSPVNVYGTKLGGMTNDGSKLIAVADNGNTYYSIHRTSGATEQFYPYEGMANLQGGNALVRRSNDGKYLVAKDNKIVQVNAELQRGVQNWTTELDLDIQGLALAGATLYIADTENDKVYKAAVPTGIVLTRDPLGLTYDGTNLWVLIDATPLDKIAKVSTAGYFYQAFEVGSSGASDITYFDNYLWVAEKKGFDTGTIRKIDPLTGQEKAVITPQNVYDRLGGLTNDGTRLLGGASPYQTFWFINKTNGNTEQVNVAGLGLTGVEAMAREATGEYLAAKGRTIAEVDRLFQVKLRDFTVEIDVEIVGMALASNTLFVADASDQKVYKTSLPSGLTVTKDPLGLTYGADHLWILVDGTPLDKILKVNPTTGHLVNRFFAPDDDTEDIVFVSGAPDALYVAVNDNDTPYGGTLRRIDKVRTTDGSVLRTLTGFQFEIYSDLVGLGKLGSKLLLTQKDGNQLYLLETNDGNVDSTLYPPFPDVPNGLRDVSHMEGQGVFGAKGDKVFRLDQESGFLIQQWQNLVLAGSDPEFELNGVASVGTTLYFADEATGKIYVASIPLPPTETTRTPKAMTAQVDATTTALYIVVEASPKDKIIKVDTSGNLVTSFGTQGVADAPSNNTDAIDFFDDALWVLTTETPPGCPQCTEPSRLRKLDKNTGAQLDFIDFRPLGFYDRYRALTNDGNKLIAGEDFGSWLLIDPDNPQGAQRVYQSPGQFPWMDGFGSMQYISAADLGLWGVRGNLFNKFNKNNGNALQTMNLQGVEDVTGLAYIGITLYLADAADDDVKISTFRERRPELTAFGPYEARLAVTSDVVTTGASASFTLAKVTSVDVEIVSPPDRVTVITETATVTGTVDDPSISAVILGAELASTILFEDDANDEDVPSNVMVENSSSEVGWHVDTDAIANSPPGAWHYAKDVSGHGNYDTPGAPNNGSLVIEDIEVGEGSALRYFTWYNTEAARHVDQKFVEINVQGDDPDQGWMALRQIVGPDPGGSYGQPPANAHQSFQFLPIPPAQRQFTPPTPGVGGCPPVCQPTIREVWAQDHVSLQAFVGETVDIRFRFDTVTDFFNTFEGWYVDDIVIEGKGSAGAATAQVVDGAFTAVFTLAEGGNQVSVTAVNSYTFPSLSDTDTITIYRDTLSPVVSLDQDTVADPDQPDLVSSAAQVTISGSIDESNFESLLMTNSVGEIEFPVLTIVGQPPSNNRFSASVLIGDGQNVVRVVVTDTAGRVGTAQVRVLRDAQGPTYTVLPTVYPVGVVSARPGDPIIFQLNAADLLSSVRCVELIFSGPGTDPAPCASTDPDYTPGQNERQVLAFDRPEDLPEAVRDTWGTTGQWLLPARVSSNSLPGTLNLRVRLTDLGDNTTEVVVQGTIVASLSAINIGLMPGANLISLPLIPTDDAAGNLTRLLGRPQVVVNAPTATDIDPALSPDKTKVAFSSDRDGDGLYDIFVKDLTTGEVTRRTNGAGNNLTPSWSSDGTRMVFVSDRDSTPTPGFFDVWVMDADGSDQTRLTSGGADGYDNFDPVFAWNDELILWVSDQGMDHFMLWVMHADGSEQSDFGGHPAAGLGRFGPQARAKPGATDFLQVLFTSDEAGDGTFDLYLYDDETEAVTRQVDRHVQNPAGAGWSPDQRWIAFVDRMGADANLPANTFVARADGSDRRQITYTGIAPDAAVHWGEDNRVYYDSRHTGNFEIHAVEPRLFRVINSIWYYNAERTNLPVEDRWQVFTPQPGDEDPNTNPLTTTNLTDLQTGRGYWVLTDAEKFEYSAALALGLPNTPKVENLAYGGVFLRSGAEAPKVYRVKEGWNLIGLHQERLITARNYLAALGRGDQAGWSSLLRFDNFIDFPIGVEDAEPRFELGHFTRVFETDSMKPTEGFWLFSIKDGVITP